MHPAGFERVELAVEQAAPVEPAERMMAFISLGAVPSKCGGDWALA
jgi:hypothetical protein